GVSPQGSGWSHALTAPSLDRRKLKCHRSTPHANARLDVAARVGEDCSRARHVPDCRRRRRDEPEACKRCAPDGREHSGTNEAHTRRARYRRAFQGTNGRTGPSSPTYWIARERCKGHEPHRRTSLSDCWRSLLGCTG